MKASLEEIKKDRLQLSKALKQAGNGNKKEKNPKKDRKLSKSKEGQSKGKDNKWTWKKVLPSNG